LSGPNGAYLNYNPVLLKPRPRPWSFHYLRLDQLPILDISKPKDVDWVNPHCAFQLSDRQRALRERGDPNVTDILMNVKDTIHSIITIYAGLQNTHGERVFGLCDPDTVGNHTLIFIDSLRLDVAAFTIVADVAILPLDNDLMPLIQRGIQTFVNNGAPLRSIFTKGKEATAWRRLIPAFVERCRTWSHKPNCEYAVAGAGIPLTTDLDGPCLCKCGRGVGLPESLEKVSEWKGLLPFATRAAISPLFAVSYVERVGSMVSNLLKGDITTRSTATAAPQTPPSTCFWCGGPGKPKLLACGKCKQAWYCSSECQLKDWKAGHKKACKMA
jgi:hypothetical protein